MILLVEKENKGKEISHWEIMQKRRKRNTPGLPYVNSFNPTFPEKMLRCF
jgi:hypothetical protein